MKLYRWQIVFLHGGKISDRQTDKKWFESVEACLKDAKQRNFTYCCGYYFTTHAIEADMETLTCDDEPDLESESDEEEGL